MLFNIGQEYDKELKILSETSSSFMLDKLTLTRKTLENLADIETYINKNKTDICENDIKFFKKAFSK